MKLLSASRTGRDVGVRAAPAIVRQVGRVRVRAAPAEMWDRYMQKK